MSGKELDEQLETLNLEYYVETNKNMDADVIEDVRGDEHGTD